ncbi:MAG: FAD-dependent oxidoreductase [Gammaproteobacteria bacterium]
MRKSRIALIAIVVLLIGAFIAFDLGQYLSLDYFKSQQARFDAQYRAHTAYTIGVFLLIYVTVTGLSLPGAAVLTLAAGALFGPWVGTLVASVGSTVGASVAFAIARFVAREPVQRRFGQRLRAVNEGVKRDGAFYLLTLRLVPVFPFFVINMVMALTPIRLVVFALVSWVGMLPATLVFANAGTQIAQVESLSGILSAPIVLSLCLLAVFPLIARKAVDIIKARRAFRGFTRPRVYERDMVVIGAGSAGLVTSYIAATVRAKVTLIEKHRMGGDCLNTGCVPSKALIRTARLLDQIKRSSDYGIAKAHAEFDFADVMDRVHDTIADIEPHDSVERYEKLGVECVAGEAQIVSPFEVRVGGRTITTRSIVIAAGARPFVPPIEGLEEAGYYTSDTLWGLREQPRRLVVLGGGPIGCELSQCFARLGSAVTQVEMLARIMIREDEEVSAMVAERLVRDGVDLRVDHKAARVMVEGGEKVLVCEHAGSDIRIAFDAILVAVGRKANTEGYGLEALGIGTTDAGTVEVNEFLQTRFPNIYACGDVAGPYQFTHMSAHQAWFASVNALFGTFRKFRADYSVVPWVTFTDPEVARVGLSEAEARAQDVHYEVTKYAIDDLDRAIADSAAHGMLKVLTVPGKDRVLGVTIVGEHAGELLAEQVLAMKAGLGLNKLLGTIHVYPTLSEANKYVAGEWKRAHAPHKLLQWVGRYHAWRRGDGDVSLAVERSPAHAGVDQAGRQSTNQST